MEEDINIHISNYETLKRNKHVIKSIDKDYFFEFVDCLIKAYRGKEESEKYLYDAYQDAGKKMFEYAEQLEDSVPKSKIKEKIEPTINSLEKDGFVGYADELRDVMGELMEDK